MLEQNSTPSPPPPPDRFNIVYWIFLLAGVNTLLPWNIFITAIPYFQYQLRNRSLDVVVVDPSSVHQPGNGSMTRDQALFGNYLGLCSLVPMSIATILCLVIMNVVPLVVRYLIGSASLIGILLLTAVLANFDLAPHTFLAITLSSAVLINAGGALFQSSVIGYAAFLPNRIMKSTLEGQAVAGIIASLASILSLLFSASSNSNNPKQSAIAYFGFATLLASLATLSFLVAMRKNAYARFFTQPPVIPVDATEEVGEVEGDEFDPSIVDESDTQTLITPPPSHSKPAIFDSMCEALLPGLCSWLSLMTTLTVFPALLVSIKPNGQYDASDPWKATFFVPVTVFLLFNVTDWIGRLFAGWLKWPGQDRMYVLLALCVARIGLVPFCLFLNLQPRPLTLPIWFTHDAFSIGYVALLGLTNGYLLSMAFIHAPSFASQGNSEGVGIAMCIYLSLGMCMGIAISYGLALILS